MTEEHIADAADMKRLRKRPAANLFLMCVGNLRGVPGDRFAEGDWDFGANGATPRGNGLTIAVAYYEVGGYAEVENDVEALARHRPGKHIATDHNAIDADGTNVREDRLQGGKIPVNIEQGRDAHAEFYVGKETLVGKRRLSGRDACREET